MINAVMLVRNRLQLTEQALRTFARNTTGEWNMTIVDDGSDAHTLAMLQVFREAFPGKSLVHTVTPEQEAAGIVGRLKDGGITLSRDAFGQHEWLYLSDNDVYFTEGWDATLATAMLAAEKRAFRLMGGQNHPYHQPLPPALGRAPLPAGVHAYLAVAGTSWLMRWNTWQRFGPLGGTAKGAGQSEDTAFCNRVRFAGYRVGALCPPVVLDTGITQTDGTLSPGHEAKTAREPGVVYL